MKLFRHSATPGEVQISKHLAIGTHIPRIDVSDGSLETLKWIALFSMTGDHINKYLFNGTIEWLFNAGRLAMPLFAFVLAYNLSRPATNKIQTHHRTLIRLIAFGSIASIPFIALGGVVAGWWPLNIMFTLATSTCIIGLLGKRTVNGYLAAIFLFLIAGSLVEFWWPAIFLCVGIWHYFKHYSWYALATIIIGLAGICVVNGNAWALAAIPLVLVSSKCKFYVPRFKWFFYSFYPLHLLALFLIRIPMRKIGYLFF